MEAITLLIIVFSLCCTLLSCCILFQMRRLELDKAHKKLVPLGLRMECFLFYSMSVFYYFLTVYVFYWSPVSPEQMFSQTCVLQLFLLPLPIYSCPFTPTQLHSDCSAIKDNINSHSSSCAELPVQWRSYFWNPSLHSQHYVQTWYFI